MRLKIGKEKEKEEEKEEDEDEEEEKHRTLFMRRRKKQLTHCCVLGDLVIVSSLAYVSMCLRT